MQFDRNGDEKNISVGQIESRKRHQMPQGKLDGVYGNDKKHKKIAPEISFRTLFRFASRKDKLMISIAFIFSCLAGAMQPFAITLVSKVFQSMINYEMSRQTGQADSETFLNIMHRFSFEYSSIGLLSLISGYIGSVCMNLSAINQIFKIRKAYFTSALHQDCAYYDSTELKGFASKMADDIIKLQEGIGDKLSIAVYNATIAVGCITMAILKGWKLALVCLSPFPISMGLLALSNKCAERMSKKEAAATGRASALAEEVLSAIRTVYAFNGQQSEVSRYQNLLGQVKKTYTRRELFSGLSMGFLFLCLLSSYAVSFYYGIYLIVHEPSKYNADVFFAVFMGVMTGMGNLGLIGAVVSSLGKARGAGAQIFYILDHAPVINPLQDRGLVPNVAEGNLELRNVVFHYPTRPELRILNGINIKIKRGQSVALVGFSGCGKSSIIQLLCRFYDVTDGQVLFDGHDVRSVSVRWLRAQVGLVGQEPVLFNTTVRENIRYGREDASDADIEAAAKQANAHQFIMKLPRGYDALVGEGGATISGGQKQRIAIARALVRNPSILLLDEATSALDLASEAKVQEALDAASQGRTTVTVAHRLSTIRNADVIYVLKDGEVIESGNHEALMAKKGHYYGMHQDHDGVGQHAAATDQELKREDSIIKDTTTYILKMEEESQHIVKEKAEKSSMNFCRVLAMNRPEWKSITAGSLCSLVIGCSTPLYIIIFGQLFGTLSNPDPDVLMAGAKNFASISVMVGFIMGFSSFFEYFLFGVASACLTARLRLLMFQHTLLQPISYFDLQANATGALCTRLSLEAAYVQEASGQRIGLMLQCASAVLLSLLSALYFEWRVCLVAMTFSPLLLAAVYYQNKATKSDHAGQYKALEGSTKVAIDAISNLRTVASLGLEARMAREYEAALAPALRPARAAAHLVALVSGLSRSMFNFMNAAALSYGGRLIVSDGIPYDSILITTQSLQIISTQLQNGFTYGPELQRGAAAAARVQRLLKTVPAMRDPDVPARHPFEASGAASFKSVEFRYPDRPKIQVFRGLDLEIERGKTLAVVGQSGCGKSTIVKLLERFYDPSAGTVALDGIPLPELLVADVRRSSGLVSQEPVLFDRSVRENIAYGELSRTPTQREVEFAAEEANIHAFIISLPEGYATNIGSKGAQLSGGQKQRIAIARALLRRPAILLLDEATSALDAQSEKLVQEALDRAKAGRTCVTIAHRLSTVRDADRICVIHDGQVAEAGTHADLMDKRGHYYKLHALTN